MSFRTCSVLVAHSMLRCTVFLEVLVMGSKNTPCNGSRAPLPEECNSLQLPSETLNLSHGMVLCDYGHCSSHHLRGVSGDTKLTDVFFNLRQLRNTVNYVFAYLRQSQQSRRCPSFDRASPRLVPSFSLGRADGDHGVDGGHGLAFLIPYGYPGPFSRFHIIAQPSPAHLRLCRHSGDCGSPGETVPTMTSTLSRWR